MEVQSVPLPSISFVPCVHSENGVIETLRHPTGQSKQHHARVGSRKSVSPVDLQVRLLDEAHPQLPRGRIGAARITGGVEGQKVIHNDLSPMALQKESHRVFAKGVVNRPAK
jgi:hypothetical protein